MTLHPRRHLRATARWVLRALLGLLVVVLGVGVLSALALSTASGKQLLLSWIVGQVNQELPGRLAVHRLETLSLSEIVLDGISLETRAGDEVAAVGRIRVQMDLWQLLHGQLVLPALLLEDATIDLRHPTDSEHGLLPALVSPTRQDDDDGGAMPEVRVEHLGLGGIEVRLPAASVLGPIDLRDLALEAKLTLGPHSVVDIDRLGSGVWRGEARLGELSLRAQLNDAGQPSRIELWSSLGDAEVQLGIAGTYTKRSDLRQLPIEVELRLSRITAALLARVLGKPAVGRAFLGSLSLELRIVGSPADLGGTATLTTRGGSIDVSSRLRGLTDLTLTLRTERLGLGELFQGAPDGRLTTTSFMSARPLDARPFALLQLRSTSAFNDSPLPALSLHAERVGPQLRAIDLRLQDANSSMHLSGTASLSGEAQLALDTHLEATSVLRLASALGKPLPHTSGRVRGTLSLVRRAGGQVTGHGELQGEGMFRRQPWRLSVLPTEISETGFGLSRVTLTFAGQRATLRGRYSRTMSELEVELMEVDLKRLLQPFQLVANPRGRLSARLLARGSIERPMLRVQLQGNGIGWAGRPALDVRTVGALDTRAGTFELDGELREHTSAEKKDPSELSLVLAARSRFKPEAAWRRSWLYGEHEAKLQISRLTGDVVSALLGRALPASFDVQAELAVRAAGGAIQTRLALADPHGAWLSLDGELAWPSTAAPAPDLPSWLDRRPTLEQTLALLDGAAWRLHLASQPRSLDQMPVPIAVPGISSAVVSARMDITRQPGREPEGTLHTEVRELKTARGSAECSSGALVARGRMELGDGRFRAEVSASDRKRQLLLMQGDGRVWLSPLIRGERPRLAEVDVTADSRGLPLAELPFLCERVQGLLNARADLRDLSGLEPRALLEVQIDGFSRGSDETLDVTAELQSDGKRVSANGTLAAAGKTSTWTAELPLARAAGSLGFDPEGPVDVTVSLERLPVAPFAGSEGAISYASGSVSGRVTARGKAAAPDLAGHLTLDDLGFTVTAIAQPLSDVDGELVFRDGQVLVKSLSARDAGGELALRGSLAIQGLRSFDGVFDLVARNFPLRQAGQVVATTSATARISPSVSGNETTLNVELASFETWLEGGRIQKGLALDPHPDLVIDGSPNVALEQSSEAEDRSLPADDGGALRHRLSLTIKAVKGFWIMRGDFSLKLRSELSMLIETPSGDEEPKLTVNGVISFDRGNLEMLGRTFGIERGGSLRFSGAPVPTVDLTATYVDRRSDDTVRARLSGRASSPELEFTINDEEATAAEALQAIYGAPESYDDDDDDMEGEAEVQAAQLLAALTAGVLTTTLRKRLGGIAPVIAIAPADEEGAQQLRAGFELDRLIPSFLRGIVTGIYVEGSVSSEQEDDLSGEEDVQRETLIELHFPHDLVTIGRYGPGATWSFDLGWRPGPF